MNSAIYYLTMFDKNTKNENTGGLVNEIFTGSSSEISLSIKICIYILTALAIFDTIYKMYKILHKNLKKKYSTEKV